MIKTTSPWYSDSQLEGMQPPNIDFIITHGEMKRFKKGEALIKPGQSVNDLIYLRRGRVKQVSMNSQGEEKIVSYQECFVTVEALFFSQPVDYSIIVDSRFAEAYFLQGEALQELLGDNAFLRHLLKVVSIRVRMMAWHMIDGTLSNAMQKICRLLCCYTVSENKDRIRLSHNELALLTGLHRVTVSNNLKELKNREIIQTDDDGYILVKNWEALKQIGFNGSFGGIL